MVTVIGKSTATITSRFLTIAVVVIVAPARVGAVVAALLLNSGGSGKPQPTTVNVREPSANSKVQLHGDDKLVVTLDAIQPPATPERSLRMTPAILKRVNG